MKAIETKYKGYRFRSRLEARWAVFFDSLKVKYEYEPEGYETKKGWYLPDFYLPQGIYTSEPYYVEVKPYQGEDFSVMERFPRLHEFAKEHNTILFDGSPDYRWYYVMDYYDEEDTSGYRDVWRDDALLADQAKDDDRWYVSTGYGRNELYESSGKEAWNNKYIEAVEAARSARFEHGEKP